LEAEEKEKDAHDPSRVIAREKAEKEKEAKVNDNEWEFPSTWLSWLRTSSHTGTHAHGHHGARASGVLHSSPPRPSRSGIMSAPGSPLITPAATISVSNKDGSISATPGRPSIPNGKTMSLSMRFYGLLKLKIFANAVTLNTDLFRDQYKHAEVSAVFRKYRTQLRKVFLTYATLHSMVVDQRGDPDERWTNTIDYTEFIQLLKDSKLLNSAFLDVKEVYRLFANIQQDVHIVSPDASQPKNASLLIKAIQPLVATAPAVPPSPVATSSTMSSNSGTLGDNTDDVDEEAAAQAAEQMGSLKIDDEDADSGILI
jgi:hypothetical protein